MKIEYETTEIIGFDLGDGEFSLAKVSMNNRSTKTKPHPEKIDMKGQSSQPTSVGRSKKSGNLVVGSLAMRSSEDISHLEINFKQKPPFSGDREKILQDFCNGVVEVLEKTGNISTDSKCVFFVGCPSAWSESERSQYQETLSATKLSNVKVAKESRAAFLHIKESGRFNNLELESGVLVIDIGSSTTDFTLVFGSSDNHVESDDGVTLGAQLIDRRIFEITLLEHEHRDELELIFKDNPSAKTRALYNCRRFKEQYFDDISYWEEQPETIITGFNSEIFEGKFRFSPHLTHNAIIDRVLNHRFSELGNLSWIEAYRKELQSVSRDIIEKTGQPPTRIVLTGSASKMQFTKEVCEEVFPNSKFEAGTETQLVVSKGLASWGRTYILTEDFVEEATKVIQKDVPRIIEENIQELIVNLSQALSINVLNKVISDAANKWNNKVILDGEKMSKEISEKISDYFGTDECAQFVKEQVQQHINKVLIEKINQVLDPICEDYRPYGILPNLLTKLDFEMKNLPPGTSYSAKFESSSFTYSYTSTTGGGWGYAVVGAAAGAGAGVAGAAAAGFAMGGPVGLVAGLSVGLLGALFASAASSETTTSTVRKTLDKNEIDKLVNKDKSKLANEIQGYYDRNSDDVKKSLIQSITNVLQPVLTEQVDRVRLLAA
jgi:hypothetical protein